MVCRSADIIDTDILSTPVRDHPLLVNSHNLPPVPFYRAPLLHSNDPDAQPRNTIYTGNYLDPPPRNRALNHSIWELSAIEVEEDLAIFADLDDPYAPPTYYPPYNYGAESNQPSFHPNLPSTHHSSVYRPPQPDKKSAPPPPIPNFNYDSRSWNPTSANPAPGRYAPGPLTSDPLPPSVPPIQSLPPPQPKPRVSLPAPIPPYKPSLNNTPAVPRQRYIPTVTPHSSITSTPGTSAKFDPWEGGVKPEYNSARARDKFYPGTGTGAQVEKSEYYFKDG